MKPARQKKKQKPIVPVFMYYLKLATWSKASSWKKRFFSQIRDQEINKSLEENNQSLVSSRPSPPLFVCFSLVFGKAEWEVYWFSLCFLACSKSPVPFFWNMESLNSLRFPLHFLDHQPQPPWIWKTFVDLILAEVTRCPRVLRPHWGRPGWKRWDFSGVGREPNWEATEQRVHH